jgi:hypothetical protein
MQFKLPTNVDLDENEDENDTYIILFNGIPKYFNDLESGLYHWTPHDIVST